MLIPLSYNIALKCSDLTYGVQNVLYYSGDIACSQTRDIFYMGGIDAPFIFHNIREAIRSQISILSHQHNNTTDIRSVNMSYVSAYHKLSDLLTCVVSFISDLYIHDTLGALHIGHIREESIRSMTFLMESLLMMVDYKVVEMESPEVRYDPHIAALLQSNISQMMYTIIMDLGLNDNDWGSLEFRDFSCNVLQDISSEYYSLTDEQIIWCAALVDIQDELIS